MNRTMFWDIISTLWLGNATPRSCNALPLLFFPENLPILYTFPQIPEVLVLVLETISLSWVYLRDVET